MSYWCARKSSSHPNIVRPLAVPHSFESLYHDHLLNDFPHLPRCNVHPENDRYSPVNICMTPFCHCIHEREYSPANLTHFLQYLASCFLKHSIFKLSSDVSTKAPALLSLKPGRSHCRKSHLVFVSRVLHEHNFRFIFLRRLPLQKTDHLHDRNSTLNMA